MQPNFSWSFGLTIPLNFLLLLLQYWHKISANRVGYCFVGFAEIMLNQGYMIVLRPDILLERYAQSDVAKMNIERLQKLRDAFSMFDVKRYRGISREPLQPFSSLDQKVINEFEMTEIDTKARRRFREILGSSSENPDVDEDCLVSLRNAQEVLSLTDNPTIWEIIHVTPENISSEGTLLGYDIGYWGGDHFSLIADTIVVPHWHPPIPDDFAELVDALSRLNENLLFNTSADAAEFRDFYKSKSWTEKEYSKGAFCIIRVNTMES